MKREIAPAISILLLIFGIVLIIGAIVFLVSGRPPTARIEIASPAPTHTPFPTSTPQPLLVYVTGAVLNPNDVHSLPFGSRVQDALTAAGGALQTADLGRINLAALLQDGDHIHLFEMPPPTLTPSSTPITTSTPRATSPGALNQTSPPTSNAPRVVRVNHATLDELVSLPGIGPALAQRIIDYRIINGRITSLDSLMNINGIGPATVEDLRGLVSFD